jgi:hypothetical protein
MNIEDLKKRVDEELHSLNGVIDYAEKMISENRWKADCEILKRRAYAKTVVLETEKKGKSVYRLTTASITDKLASGLATPYSPIGMLCSVANVGFDGESKMLGEFEVIETRLFDRFDGIGYLNNVRNFFKMEILTTNHSDEVIDLKNFVDDSQKIIATKTIKKIEKPIVKKIETVQPKIETPIFIIEDDELETTSEHEFDDEDDDFDDIKQDDSYFGLNEVFYVNQTIQQHKIIARSPLGAMYIEGVAGSGKTSAALGRTKMLCGFNSENVFEKSQFEEVLGDNFDYWEGKYAGKFSQDGSIGFVRTAELIKYLEETCRRIDLPNLPIHEYTELQITLKNRHKITSSQLHYGNWKGGATRDSHIDTTMRWLFAADKNIAYFLSKNLQHNLPSGESIANRFVKDEQWVLNVVKKAFEHFRIEFNRIEKELCQSNSHRRFLLDGLAEKVNQAIKLTSKEILGKNTLWFFYQNFALCANSERGIAELLITNNVPLLNKSGSKFKFADIDDLYLKLLPESNNKPYLLYDENKLIAIKLEQFRGYGSRQLLESWTIHKIRKKVLIYLELITFKPIQNPERKTSIRSIFIKSLEKALINKLHNVADMYYLALNESIVDYSDSALATNILAQLKIKKIANQDIDLLLCLSHLINKNFSRFEHKFYQSVFVDEVQDFTEQQIYLMAEQADPEYKAVTLVGDIAQKLHNGQTIDIQSCFPNGKIPFIQLTDNLRQLESPVLALFSHIFRNYFQTEKIELSSQLLSSIQSIKNLVSPEIYHCKTQKELDLKIIELVVSSQERQTLAVILPSNEFAKKLHERVKTRLDEDFIDHRFSEKNVDLSKRFIKHFMSILNAKGLEFDTVILPYLEGYDLKNKSDINKLYVGITRAKKRLIILRTKENELFSNVLSNFEFELNRIK